MPKMGNNIYHRKDGRWEARFVKGRKGAQTIFGYAYGKTYQEAMEKRTEAIRVWKERKGTSLPRNTNLNAVSEEWMQSSVAHLKESSIAKYKACLRCYILPVFGEKGMEEITNKDVNRFCNSLLQRGGTEGKGLSNNTVVEILSIMKQLRKYALNYGYAVGYSNDCTKIPSEKKAVKVFSMEEQKRLQEYLTEHPTLKNMGLLLCLGTGLRVGELCALTWDDISLKERKLTVNRTIQRIRDLSKEKGTKLVLAEPKSECAARTIPLSEQLCDFLASACKPGTCFLTGETEKFMDPRTMQKCLPAVLEACGIGRTKFHALRHTFATRWTEAGLDMKCLSEVLGHSTTAMTMNRYVHPSMETKRQGMEALREFLV